MENNNYQTIYSAQSTLQAISVQGILEKAGILALITPSSKGSYLDLVVPKEYAYDALNLTAPHSARGEVFLVVD